MFLRGLRRVVVVAVRSRGRRAVGSRVGCRAADGPVVHIPEVVGGMAVVVARVRPGWEFHTSSRKVFTEDLKSEAVGILPLMTQRT